ncbi:MAG: hypothetical protein CEE38_11600 [Planctomycetes bacterium B3_Pla]|nr:MAG: hypothetical protein CEE38_11600 [Planctomycetes bacterium B3_Pla]
MTEHCISVSTDSMPEKRPLPVQAKVRHIVVLALCVLAVSGSLLLRHGGDGLYLFGIRWPAGCPLYQNFDVKCALCGLTRSFCSIAKGDFSGAAQFHSLGPAFFVFVCLQIPYRIYALLIAHTENKKLRLTGICLALMIAGGLLINWLVYLGGLIL